MSDKEKELRLTMKLSNNRLRKRIAETKLTVPEAAELAEISHSLLCGYIALRVSPVDTQGRWKGSALDLCDALTVSPEYLWPESVLAVISPTLVTEMDAADLAPQLLSTQMHAIPLLAEEVVGGKELRSILDAEMKLLTPREEQILKMRYGYNEDPLDFMQIGERLKLSHERVRQVWVKATGKLRESLLPQVSGESLLPTEVEIRAEFDRLREEEGCIEKARAVARVRRRLISNSLAKQKARFKAKLRLIRID